MAEVPATSAPEAPQAEVNQPVVPEIPKGEKVYIVKHPDGREEKWWGDKVQERLQKSVGLEEKRVSEAARYEQAFTNFVSKVQDPNQLFELLKHPDLKYDEEKQESLVKAMLSSKNPRIINVVKRWIYDNEVEPELLKAQDPKEFEKRQWQRKAEELESEKLKREKELRVVEEEKEQGRIKEAYRVQLGDAYKASGLPIDDFLVRQVMEKARLYVRAGKHPDFKNCCALVQQDFINQTKAILGKATVDNILTMLDGETAQTINKALMKAVDKKDALPTDPNEPRTQRPRKKEKERSPAETKKWLRNLERGIVD